MSRLEHISAELFGRAMRLPVALWVLEQEDDFYIKQAAEETGYSSSNVSAELSRLVTLGMLRRKDRSMRAGRQYFTRLNSPLWDIIRAASAAVDEE